LLLAMSGPGRAAAFASAAAATSRLGESSTPSRTPQSVAGAAVLRTAAGASTAGGVRSSLLATPRGATAGHQPPFQSDVEQRERGDARGDTYTARASGKQQRQQLRLQGDDVLPTAVTGLPPLPLPSGLTPSTLACVAVSPIPPSLPPVPAPAMMGMAGAVPAAAAAYTAVATAAYTAPPGIYLAMGVVACVFGSALSAFLLAIIPVLHAVKGAADEIAYLAASIREEVPDTFAAVRLGGMELTDCLEEVGELTAEVGSGVKNTSRAVSMGYDTAGTLGTFAATTVKRVIPEVQRRATPLVRRVLARTDDAVAEAEGVLEENAGTKAYSGPVVVAAARATKSGVQYARGALRAAGVARKVGQLYKSARDIQQAGASEGQGGGGSGSGSS